MRMVSSPVIAREPTFVDHTREYRPRIYLVQQALVLKFPIVLPASILGFVNQYAGECRFRRRVAGFWPVGSRPATECLHKM